MGEPLDKLAPALVALQADLKPVEKSAANPFFKSKYAPLPAVMEAVQPLLAKHKLAVSQFVTHLDGQSALRTILLHESGQSLEDVQPLLLAKQDPQGQGSAITYARRYGVMAVLGLVADEDDDGNAASSPQRPARDLIVGNPPAASPNKPATDKQKSMIAALAHKAGKDQVWIDNIMNRPLMSDVASNVIGKLKAEVGEGEEPPRECTWR